MAIDGNYLSSTQEITFLGDASGQLRVVMRARAGRNRTDDRRSPGTG